MTLKERLLNKEPVKGLFAKCSCPELIEMIGYAGMDFVVLDMEHANLAPQEVENLIRAAECSGLTPMVRLPSPAEEHVIHALDSGARGLIIPGVTNVAEAEAAVRLTKFYPEGMRGMNGGSRAARHGFMSRAENMEKDNREIITMLMVESLEMLAVVDELTAIPALDGVFIGPADLSQSMGIPGQTMNNALLDNVKKIAEAANSHGKFAGAFTGTDKSVTAYRERGVRLFVYGTEMSLLKGALTRAKGELDTLLSV